MNRRVRFWCTVSILLLGISGCRHKPPPPAPAAAKAPPLTPSALTVITPLPSVPAQPVPQVLKAQAAPPAPKPKVQPVEHKRRRRHKTPEPSVASNAETPKTEIHPAEPGPETPPGGLASEQSLPALGELSTGTAISSTERTSLLNEIAVQEVRVKKAQSLKNPAAEAILVQVKTFLGKARQAVEENDLDGARTLNMKATVLLDELQSD